jgi:hypothetical protein
MIHIDYLQLVRELCKEAGIENWQDVAQSQHVDIDGVTTGLIFDEHAAPDTLGVYFELEVIHDDAVLRRLLEYNAAFDPEGEGVGRFGLLPESGSVCYRVDVPFTPATNGAGLSAQLARFLQCAQQGLSACLAG